jgi:hypothetical protein
MGEMADRMQAQIEADGGLEGDAAVPGTGMEGQQAPPEGASNTDTSSGGPPETIPYSRFQEVNSRLNDLKPYEELAQYGIEADSALRLANFEAAYVEDPKAIIGSLIDNQQDLSDETKAAMRSLLAQEARAGAQGDEGEGQADGAIPPEVAQRLAQVDQIMQEREEADRQARLDVVVRHWDGLDKQDEIDVPERTKLVWISAAASNGGYETLEQLAEAARTAYFEDRDHSLGSVVQSRGTGTPRSVPGSAAAPAPPEEFKDFGAANKQIMADIKAGRLPGMEMES